MTQLPTIQYPLAAQVFLRGFDKRTRERGKDYYYSGVVRKLACVEPGRHYVAEVEGSSLYETQLVYEGNAWVSACSCPVAINCKHAYAAMLQLLELASAAVTPMPGAAPRRSPGSSPAAARVAPPPQPAGTLEAELAVKLGRAPRPDERRMAKQLQDLFVRSRAFHSVALHELQTLFRGVPGNSWDRVNWWPRPPADALEFWRFLAHGLRERGVEVPRFLAAIDDPERAAADIAHWRRQQQIEHWQRQLARLNDAPEAVTAGAADARLAFGPDKAVLEWKGDAAAAFAPLKVTSFKRLAEAFESGRVEVLPEAFPIWQACVQRWRYHRGSEFSYRDPESNRILNALLRNHVLHDRLVTADGAPLARPAEPLRWQLEPAATGADDYRLWLVTAEGAALDEPLAVLPGQPTLYLATTAVFHGPPPLAETNHHDHYGGYGSDGGWTPDGRAGRLSRGDPHAALIPAPALETRHGVDLLLRLGVELPPRLQQRVRRVAMTVKVFCDLKPLYSGSDSEALFVRVTAETETGDGRERLTSGGWLDDSPQRTPKRTKAEDVFLVNDRSALAGVPASLEPLGMRWDACEGLWRLRVTKKFPDLFVRWLASLPKHIEVNLDRELATLTRAPVSGSVRLEIAPAGVDWFDLQVVLDVADTELTPAELKVLLNARGGYVRLGQKGWRRLQFNLTDEEDERLSRLGLTPRDFSAEPQRLHALQLADEAATKLLPEAQVGQIRRRVSEIKTRVAPPVPDGIRAQLRPYQVEGFHFLAYLSANRFGGILADDMGLGKTLQTLAWLAWLRAQDGNAAKPSLVVCPKSVMDNWHAETANFLPGLRVKLWRGADAAALPAALAETDLLVINYAQLRALADNLAGVPWLAVILDEGQYIKNPQSLTAHAARTLKADQRLVLTGTPIENRLLDLWSLMSFAMPGVLGNRAGFAKFFDQAEDPLARRRLSARVRPFLLRRTKAQVATDLPDRIEEDLHCEMEGGQQTLYRAEFKHAQQMLLKVKTSRDFDAQRFNFLTSLLRLRQICCHPALVDEKQKKTESAKLSALLDLLEPLMEEGHKVLVFSQFVSMLDLVRPVLQEKGWPHFYLAGDTENRGKLVAEFQRASGAAVFLISLKAGGFGLNLTAASYVVLYDPWWNPAVENQAIDRTHRIGQTSNVIAYRLLIKGTIEEKIRVLQRTKRALAEDVLGEEGFAKSLTIEDLRFLFAGDAP